PTDIYTLSLHDALPISRRKVPSPLGLLGHDFHHAAQAPRIDRVDLAVVAVVLVVRARIDVPRRPQQLEQIVLRIAAGRVGELVRDRKSTRLNSSHLVIS